MINCNGRHANNFTLKDLFTINASSSRHLVNVNKSPKFSSSISHVKLIHIAHYIGFTIGALPFKYLGVTIFKGRPKFSYFNLFQIKSRQI